MLAWAGRDEEVTAVCGGVAVSLGAEGWRPLEETAGDGRPAGLGWPLPRPVQETLSGSVEHLDLPSPAASLSGAADVSALSRPTGSVPGGEFVLDCEPLAVDGHASPRLDTSVAFRGPARLDPTDGGVRLSFPERRPVTLGFVRRAPPAETVIVPPTPGGVAAGLTALTAGLTTTGPERSHPAYRVQPPRIETGSTLEVPGRVERARPETGVELVVPEELASLFVVAPLAYYLGAEVTARAGATPRLRAPGAGLDLGLSPLPEFQHEVASLLRRVFFFDCLVRDLEPETPPAGSDLLERFEMDPATLRDLSPAERLARYLRVPTAAVEDHLPDWHLSTYVEPDPEHVSSLPYLLESLGLVYLPESSKLEGTELLERTLDDFYRASEGPVRSVDALDPELQDGRVHAWLAPGTPIDAFKPTPRAFANRDAYRDRPGKVLDVSVVLNDEAMSDEHAAVAEIYRERAADLPLDVTVTEHLTVEELSSVFASPTDLVHYIGHCDVDGLQCTDGRFAARDLEACRTRTFFLNACGSFHEGLGLVERGAVAGAVTLTRVIDRQAAKVGTAFARLLVHGFGIERAMQLSRRRIMMGKDYAVVGDGTYSLAPNPDPPSVLWLEHADGGFRVTCEVLTARTTGRSYRPPFGTESRLYGSATEATLDRASLVETLENRSMPVIYDGEFHWSDRLAAELAG